jgi:hypothetical protein
VVEKDKGFYAQIGDKSDNEVLDLLKTENEKIEMKNNILLKQKEK